MTRKELLHHLRTLSSGTIAEAIGSTRYSIIDKAINSAILYAARTATDAEISQVSDLSGILSFLRDHSNHGPF